MNSSAKGCNNKSNNSAPCIINCNHTPTAPTGFPAPTPPPPPPPPLPEVSTLSRSRPDVAVSQNQHAPACGTTTTTTTNANNATLPISNTKHAFGLSPPIMAYPYCLYNGPHHHHHHQNVVLPPLRRMNPNNNSNNSNNNATVTATLPPLGTSGTEGGGGVGNESLPSPTVATTATTATAIPIPVTQIVQNVLRKTEIGSTSMIHYDSSSSVSSIHGNAGIVLVTPNHPPPKLRSGKWIPEEESYAVFLVQLFFQGILLDCADGTTLRAYLTPKLRCTPMRISKKFAGKRIGKVLYQQSTRKKMDATTNAQLRSLERQFQVATTRFPPGTFAVPIDRHPASTTTSTTAILPTTSTTTTMTTTGTTVDHNKNRPIIWNVPSQQIPVPQSIPTNHRSPDAMTTPRSNISNSADPARTLTHGGGGFGRPVVKTETGGQPYPFTLNAWTPTALAQSSALGGTPTTTTYPPTVSAHNNGPTTMAVPDSTVGQTQSSNTKPPSNISHNGDNNNNNNNNSPPNNNYYGASAETMCIADPIHCPSTVTSMEEGDAVETASKYHNSSEAFNDADAANGQFISRPTSPSLDDFHRFLTKELMAMGATISHDDSTQQQSLSPKRGWTILDSTTNPAMMMMMMMGVHNNNNDEELDYDSILATPKRSLLDAIYSEYPVVSEDTITDGTTTEDVFDDLIDDSMFGTSKKQRRLLSEVFTA